jgi:hypothetical protein
METFWMCVSKWDKNMYDRESDSLTEDRQIKSEDSEIISQDLEIMSDEPCRIRGQADYVRWQTENIRGQAVTSENRQIISSNNRQQTDHISGRALCTYTGDTYFCQKMKCRIQFVFVHLVTNAVRIFRSAGGVLYILVRMCSEVRLSFI